MGKSTVIVGEIVGAHSQNAWFDGVSSASDWDHHGFVLWP